MEGVLARTSSESLEVTAGRRRAEVGGKNRGILNKTERRKEVIKRLRREKQEAGDIAQQMVYTSRG